MSETKPNNLTSLDSLGSYLGQNSQPQTQTPQQTQTTPQIMPQTAQPKDPTESLKEIEAKIKMMEIGGGIAERLITAGNQVVDKIISAKQMEFMAQQTPQPQQTPQIQAQNGSVAPPIDSEQIYSGVVQMFQFFVNMDKEMKVADLLAECINKPDVAKAMINKYMSQIQAQPQPQEVQTEAQTN